jgi:PAS domain S-box-containing protein
MRVRQPTVWLLAVLLVGLVAAATVYMKATVDRALEEDFVARCDDIRQAVADRLDNHARILLSGAALFRASATVTREEWRIFTQHQQVERQLPGIQGVGFSLLIPRAELARHLQEIRDEGFPEYTVKPEGDREFYSAIIYLEPFAGRNVRAFGYDMLAEPVRRTAMERARDTNFAALSGKVVLVQETNQDIQAGALMYVPVYRRGLPTDTVAQRQAAIYGWVYSPYRMGDLMQGILGVRGREKERALHLKVFDGEDLSTQNLLHESHPAADESLQPGVRFARRLPVDFNGQRWTLSFTQGGGGIFTAAYTEVWIALVGGTLVALLLFTLVRVLVNTGGAAQRLAAELTTGMRESRERHGTILQTAMDGFWLADARGHLLEVNETYCRMSGYSKAELLAMCIADLDVAETPSDTAIHMHWVMAQGERRFESQHRCKDGRLMDVEVSMQYRAAEGGLFVAFLRDIGERKQTDEQVRTLLAESNQARLALLSILEDETRAEARSRRLATAVEQAAEAIFITDSAWIIQYVNPAFETVTGYTGEEVIGQNPRIFKGGQEDEAAYLELWRTITSGAVWQGRFVERKKDGTLHTGEATVSPVRDDAGEIVSYVAVERDITEQLRVAARLQQAQKMESLGRLAGGVAHDFNNLLMGIMNYVDLCRDRLPADHAILTYLDEITQDSQRTADLTRQLLAFARKQLIAPKALNLNDALLGMLKMLRHLLGANIRLDWRPGTAIWTVKIDPSQLDQILVNLSLNARDAIRGVGQLTIETRNATSDAAYCAEHVDAVPGDYVMLAVGDSGRGMDRQTIQHLFEPFFTTKGAGEGVGMGLATIYGIIRQNNGFIDVQSEPGEGTIFRIYLPRCHDAPVPVPPVRRMAERPRGTETILLAEDEKAIRVTTRLFLEALGYTVLEAADAEEALRLAAAHAGEIHLLLTDVVMPGQSGRDLARRLVAQRPTLKCLFMSGYTADILADRGVIGEDMHFLAKPVSRDSLARKLREVLA